MPFLWLPNLRFHSAPAKGQGHLLGKIKGGRQGCQRRSLKRRSEFSAHSFLIPLDEAVALDAPPWVEGACAEGQNQVRGRGSADERTINTFGQHYLNGAGVATPDPGVCAAAGGV